MITLLMILSLNPLISMTVKHLFKKGIVIFLRSFLCNPLVYSGLLYITLA
jgi:hypothetical protein